MSSKVNISSTPAEALMVAGRRLYATGKEVSEYEKDVLARFGIGVDAETVTKQINTLNEIQTIIEQVSDQLKKDIRDYET